MVHSSPVCSIVQSGKGTCLVTLGARSRVTCRVNKLISRDVDTQGVCNAADQFYQNFKYWKFAFHKDQDLIETPTTRSDSDLDEADEHADHLLVSSI